jgi:hypothetical protein
MTDEVEDFLAHYGVKGMRWGVRRDPKTGARPIAVALNDSAFGRLARANNDRYNRNKTSRSRVRQAEARARAGYHTNRPKKNTRQRQIDEARARVASGETKEKYKKAKSKYKNEKKTLGRAEARRNLRRAKDKKLRDLVLSDQIRDGGEFTAALIAGLNEASRQRENKQTYDRNRGR